MKLLLTFVVCTVFDYLDAITFRAAIRDDTLDHDGAPPGQFVNTEYHLKRYQSPCNHYRINSGFEMKSEPTQTASLFPYRFLVVNSHSGNTALHTA
jgi:hypothetical protein